MIRTEKARRYGGTTAIPLTEFRFITPEKKYVIQDALIEGEKCIIIKEEKEVEIKQFRLEEVKAEA